MSAMKFFSNFIICFQNKFFISTKTSDVFANRMFFMIYYNRIIFYILRNFAQTLKWMYDYMRIKNIHQFKRRVHFNQCIMSTKFEWKQRRVIKFVFFSSSHFPIESKTLTWMSTVLECIIRFHLLRLKCIYSRMINNLLAGIKFVFCFQSLFGFFDPVVNEKRRRNGTRPLTESEKNRKF